MSFRAGLGLGCAAAMLAAVPAAVRVAADGGSLALGWLLLAGGSALVLGPAVALARHARPLPSAVLAVLAGSAAVSIPLAVFARLLHQNTHHRPLGAATFAVVGLLLIVVASFVAWRALAWLQVSSSRARLLTVSVFGVTTLGAVALLALTGAAREWRGSVLDGAVVLVLLAVSVGLRVGSAWGDRLSRLAVPTWALLVVLGAGLSRAAIGPVVGQEAPVLSPLNGW
ncbi:MAG TPA: hypothetical protein VM686_10880 [Polyangiaceae bacterium]|nr:hypothetical protein [Polyangiaceae bacterium]